VITALAASVLAGFFICWASWDYAADVFRRKTDPRLASWALWASASGIAAAAAWQTHPRFWPSAALAGVDASTCLVLVAAGFAWGTRDVARLDVAGAATGTAGLVLLALALLRPDIVPAVPALVASVFTDLAGLVPVLVNGLRGKETPSSYVKFAVAGAVVLAAAALDPAYRQANGLVFPAYLAVASVVMAAVAIAGRRQAAVTPECAAPAEQAPASR
jgi:hypothetical protein